MPKSTHQHQSHDAFSTDNKFPPDERDLARDKREFQQSETDKKHEPQSEKEFVDEQDEKNEK
jgi:hypothetical protein